MKRDNDYIRELLLQFEAQDSDLIIIPPTVDQDRRKIHHVRLMCDAGLLNMEKEGVYRLSYQGHDFIEAIRDPGIWQKVVEKAGGAGIDILIGLAKGFLKEEIAKHTGFDF